MEAILIYAMDPRFHVENINKKVTIEDYILWCQQHQIQYITACCRNDTEMNIVARDFQDQGFIPAVLRGTVPNNYNDWAFETPVVEDTTEYEWRSKESEQKVKEGLQPDHKKNVEDIKPVSLGYYEYLQSMGGKERHEFDTPDEAYNFGQNLRKNIETECYDKHISVEISNTIVRVNILDINEVSV